MVSEQVSVTCSSIHILIEGEGKKGLELQKMF